ncbi:MAG: ATP-dependent Clp protease ATP-binding subunit [bacterium]
MIHKKFNNYSLETIKNAILLALKERTKLEPKHIFLSMIKQKGSIAYHLLKTIAPIESVKQVDAERRNENLLINFNALNISDETKKVIEKSILTAALYRHKYIGTEHLLFGVLEINNEYINNLLKESKIDPNYLKSKLKSIFKNTASFPAFYPNENITEEDYDMPDLSFSGAQENFKKQTKKTSYLDNFCVDLTNENFQKDIDPVIGREKELERLAQILARRNKNNPILIGEAGVGKTAIIEGLAKKIAMDEIPSLIGKKIFSLDINALVAGTTFRGEFEARLKNLLAELSANTNIIIFIDEIHNIIGAGSASGTLDAANILKPILARGQIRFIGATTFNEYKKYIEKDPALERRFQSIIIKEPQIEETIKILNGIKTYYEDFHNITITDGAIISSVKLSQRYIKDRLLPDKAIDLIDEAASKYKIGRHKNDPDYKIKKLEKHLEEVILKKERSVIEENFSLANKYKNEEIGIKNEIALLNKNINSAGKSGIIDDKIIYKTISDMMNIPQKDLTMDRLEENNIKNIEASLKKKIIGQDETIKKIANVLKRSFSNISSPNRPIGSFLFLGPSGVGKTEIAKTLARALFNDEKSLIRLDMGEFAESFNISKLIGAPAGYVGFEQGGKLTEEIRRNPYSIILLDELEKANRAIFNLFLQMLEEGTLTDASGRIVNFRNCIIIMTCNLGIDKFNKEASLGFELISSKKQKRKFEESYKDFKNNAIKEIKRFFPAEFLNRIDNISIFNPLYEKEIKKITELELKEFAKRLEEMKLKINFDNKVISYLTKKAISNEQGARLVKRVIQENIEDFIADKLINKELNEKDEIKLSVKDNNIFINTASGIKA